MLTQSTAWWWVCSAAAVDPCIHTASWYGPITSGRGRAGTSVGDEEKQWYLDPSLLFASGHQSQVPEMFGPYFEIPPSAWGRGWPQLHQPADQVGTSDGSGWLARATAWWQGSLSYVHGAVPSTLFHSKELRDASREHWDRAEGLFGEKKIKIIIKYHPANILGRVENH